MGENAKKERRYPLHVIIYNNIYILYITITHQAKRKKSNQNKNIITNIYLSDHPSNSFVVDLHTCM